jgi:hypothetical protein
VFNPSAGSFKGFYVISDRQADELAQKLHIVGSDDGTSFWNVEGEWTDKKSGTFEAYFSHRNDGTPDQQGVLSTEGIAWNNSKVWTPLKTPSFGLADQTLSDPTKVGGFYIDPEIDHHHELFVGTRMIGANYFPNITIVGTEDGSIFWSVVGRWDKTPGQFRADFKAIGGQDNTTGKLDKGAILWADGRYWRKQSATSSPDAILEAPMVTV